MLILLFQLYRIYIPIYSYVAAVFFPDAIDERVAQFERNVEAATTAQEVFAVIKMVIDLNNIRYAQVVQARNFNYATVFNMEQAIQAQDREMMALRTLDQCTRQTRDCLLAEMNNAGQNELEVIDTAEEDKEEFEYDELVDEGAPDAAADD